MSDWSAYYDFDGEPISQVEWARLMGQWPKRQVAVTVFDGVEVSTVWIGLDVGLENESPLIFETMIFGGPYDHWRWRHPTREAALAGHDQATALVRDSLHRV